MSYTLAVQANKVTKYFGPVRALKDVDLQIPTGITYGVIGPNGSGKTTLIRLLAGLSRPTSGEITVLGESMPTRAVARHIGYMTQQEALYQDLTARENLRFFGVVYGLGRRKLERRINEMVELVGLEDSVDRVVATFSGGMRQRLSLAIALLHRPELALLDEPTVGVDPELRLVFWQHFHELNRQGTTIVVSTHHLDEAARCDRLGLLREGTLIAEGTTAELTAKAGVDTIEKAFLFYAGVEKNAS